MTNSTLTPAAVLERKKRLGRRVTYTRIARIADLSQTTVYVVMNERQTGIPIDRGRVLEQIDDALDQIQEEQEKERAGAA